jgi:hypothetical protein
MDAVTASRLCYLGETHKLRPGNHTGGRKQESSEHALHLIIDKICEA